MRTLFSVAWLALTFAACSGPDTKTRISSPGEKTTTIAWVDSTLDYGKINEGQKLSVSFRFKNTGTNPLIIESVTPGCGCTVADFPKEPIAPGQGGEITGEFNSESHPGHQHKAIAVKANTGGFGDNLYFDVDVIPEKQPTDDPK